MKKGDLIVKEVIKGFRGSDETKMLINQEIQAKTDISFTRTRVFFAEL